jgi:hypothetical protein
LKDWIYSRKNPLYFEGIVGMIFTIWKRIQTPHAVKPARTMHLMAETGIDRVMYSDFSFGVDIAALSQAIVAVVNFGIKRPDFIGVCVSQECNCRWESDNKKPNEQVVVHTYLSVSRPVAE